MSHIHLIHNSTAGKGHSKDDLLPLIESFGYQCHYTTCIELEDSEWPREVKFIVIAGGDGTIKQAIKNILNRKLLYETKPIAFLPIGTANNFSKSLGVKGNKEEIVSTWRKASIKKMDIGRIYNHPEVEFFIESVGFGIFPTFLDVMKNVAPAPSPEESIKNSLKGFYDVSSLFEAKECILFVDGIDYSGKYILIEIMNTTSIGPNLVLSPKREPGDGWLDVVLVEEKDRNALLSYLQGKMDGEEDTCQLPRIKGKEVSISWPTPELHIDDIVVAIPKNQALELGIREGILHYLQPAKES